MGLTEKQAKAYSPAFEHEDPSVRSGRADDGSLAFSVLVLWRAWDGQEFSADLGLDGLQREKERPGLALLPAMKFLKEKHQDPLPYLALMEQRARQQADLPALRALKDYRTMLREETRSRPPRGSPRR